MSQNQMSDEEIDQAYQRIDEEIGQNQSSDEESGENQRSDEETDESDGENQSSGEETNEDTDENQSGDEETDENQSGGEETDESDGENESSGEETNEDTDENQSGDEETGENQRSDEETGGNEKIYEECCENQQSDEEWDVEKAHRCIVSDPAHPHNLSPRAGYKTKHKCISCGKRSISWKPHERKNIHYYCTICQVEFHRACRRIPSKMIHPYHPQHPLTFTFLHKRSGKTVDTNFGEHHGFLIKHMPEGFHKPFEIIPSSSIMFDKCTWCDKDLGEWFYRCLICNFSLDFHCALKFPPLIIKNPKSHHHSLSLFPRPLSFPCNACGLIDLLEPGYACYQCNYVVHQSCVDLPRIIKVTRHPHRLSYTPYRPTKVSSCRICYKNVDIKYGQYSCNHEDCSYIVHSKCVTRLEVWDEKELEWEAEESDQTEDIAPYKKVGGDLIEHFCHDHHYLKLEKYQGTRDPRKQCQACMRSITCHDFYNCIECDFCLHEVCANLPRKLDHALHVHSLLMDMHPTHLSCKVCYRKSSGWMYTCKKEECELWGTQFQVDVNCVLVPECFSHESHTEHLLFATGTYDENCGEICCQHCKMSVYEFRLQCIECAFTICFKCSTIPNELYNKFDEHPLSLCYGESGVDDKYWCELCEKRLDPTEWFYTNKERCTTIHLECLFGDFAYMKSGHTIDFKGHNVEIVSNSSSRPICGKCQHRCPHSLYLREYMLDGSVGYFCSFYCILMRTLNE